MLNFYRIKTDQGVRCLPCLDPCTSCSGNISFTVCDSCIPGYYTNFNEIGCVPCSVENCYNCSLPHKTNICVQCISSFYLTEGLCNPCSKGCGICSNISVC